MAKVEEVNVEAEGKLAVEEVNMKVEIIVENGQLSVSSDTSLVETLFMINDASRFVLERALVNSQVAQEAEED